MAEFFDLKERKEFFGCLDAITRNLESLAITQAGVFDKLENIELYIKSLVDILVKMKQNHNQHFPLQDPKKMTDLIITNNNFDEGDTDGNYELQIIVDEEQKQEIINAFEIVNRLNEVIELSLKQDDYVIPILIEIRDGNHD